MLQTLHVKFVHFDLGINGGTTLVMNKTQKTLSLTNRYFILSEPSSIPYPCHQAL